MNTEAARAIEAVLMAATEPVEPVELAQLVELPVAEVEGIYVTPEARGVSLGEEMLTTLVATATEAGAREIDATALPGDRDTKNLYERFGLVARLIVVSRRLEP